MRNGSSKSRYNNASLDIVEKLPSQDAMRACYLSDGLEVTRTRLQRFRLFHILPSHGPGQAWTRRHIGILKGTRGKSNLHWAVNDCHCSTQNSQTCHSRSHARLHTV